MEKIFFFYCIFSFCIMQITSSAGGSSDVLRVQTGRSLTLNCSMRNRYEVSWYRFRSEELVLLISAEKAKNGRDLIINYNPNSNRMRMTADGWVTRASLTISGVTEADSGLYFCGTKSDAPEMHFDKPVRLEIEDEVRVTRMKTVTVTEVETVTDMERMLMFGGVGLAVFVFFLATLIAGRIIHHHAWQKGWKAAKRSSLSHKSVL